jgi:hypothetical protein
VTSDGEAVILWQSIAPAVVQAFKDNHADLAKGGPSATSVQQPCDVSSEFEDLKAGTKKVISSNVDVTNEILQDAMKTYWLNLNEYIKSICTSYATNPKPVSHAMKEKIIKGLEVIVYVSQNGYMTPSKARKGFTRVGFHTTSKVTDPILGFEDSTVDFDLIMKQCYQEIPKDIVNFVKSHSPELIRQFQINGKLVTEDYKEVGIWQLLANANFTMIPRDDKVIWQQHAQVMTHDRTVAQWTGYILGRDPATIAANATIEAANKAAEKLAETELRVARRLLISSTRAENKKVEKEIEKVRVANLSGEEKRAHEDLLRRNKIIAQEKKVVNIVAKEAKHAAAIALVAAASTEN